jgi:Spy/CpxP family protein refolding chaperone
MQPCTPAWRDPRIISVLLLVFLCGSAAGALGWRYTRVSAAAPNPAQAWKEGGRDITLQKFRKELNLTDEQAQEIAVILDDFMMYLQTLQAQIDDVRASGKDRIVKILNAQQREKFSRMMTEFQSRQIR